jgi:hypothetical protein
MQDNFGAYVFDLAIADPPFSRASGSNSARQVALAIEQLAADTSSVFHNAADNVQFRAAPSTAYARLHISDIGTFASIAAYQAELPYIIGLDAKVDPALIVPVGNSANGDGTFYIDFYVLSGSIRVATGNNTAGLVMDGYALLMCVCVSFSVL